MDVLGRALELGERGDRLARLGRGGVVDLEEESLVRLDDEWAVIHSGSLRERERSERSRGVIFTRQSYGRLHAASWRTAQLAAAAFWRARNAATLAREEHRSEQ